MAKNPWEVVSVEPVSADPWEVVSVDDLPKEESFFSLDRAKRVAKDVVSLIPGLGDVADPEPVARREPMTPQQIERAAAIDATERENLRAINPGANSDQINALLEQRRSERASAKPAATVEDRISGYQKSSPGMSRQDAQANAVFDASLEQKLNDQFQQAEADPITGERISTAYRPELEAGRVAKEQEAVANARDDVLGRQAAEKMGSFASGLAKSGIQLVGSVYGVMALADDLLGDNAERDENLKKKQEFDRYVSQLSSAPQFTEIASVDDAGRWLSENGGYVAGQAIMAIASGGAGSLLGNTVGRAAIGEAIGLGLQNATQTFGQVYADAIETARAEGKEPPPMWQILTGSAASTIIDTVADKIGLDAVTARGFKGSLALRLAKSTGLQMAVQGGTEAAQLVPEEIGAGRDPFRKGMLEQYINEGAVGALGGVGPGAVGSIRRNVDDTPQGMLAAALEQGELGQVDVVDILRQESTLTGGEIRPEATTLAAAQATQAAATREAEMAIGQAQSVDEAIALAGQAINQGTVLAEITSRVSQNDQLQQTLAALGSTPVQAPDQATAQPVVGAEPGAVATPVGGPDAAAGPGQPQSAEALTYATPELAQQAAEQQGVAEQIEISDTGDGYVLAPKSQPKTVRQLREQYTIVSELQDAIERTGGAGRAIAVRSSFSVPLQTEGSGRSDAGADVGRTLELVSGVVEKAFGRAPIPVSGLGAFGVAYNGNLFIDVEQASSGDKAGNSGVALAISTIGHESTHALLQQSRDPADQAAYKNFRAVVLQYAKDGVIERRQADETKAAGGAEQAGLYGTRAYAESEVVADVSGAMWLDNKFWQRLYEVDNGSTMRRVLYKFMQAATRFIEAAKGSRLDAGAFVTNIDAVREAAAQAWAQRAGKQNPPAEIADLPAFSRGVSAEVAPDPRNTDMVQRWAALDTPAKERVTRQVMDEVAPKVFADLGLSGWSVEYTTGSFEGQVNPSAVIRAPEGTSAEQLGEVMRVFGYVLDQKGMVAFDENNTTSDSQAGFVKVILPEGLSAARIDAIRQTVSSAVPQAEGETLRDGSLVFGNFSEYNDNVETLSDEAFKQAIVDALVASNPAENIDVAGPFRFHREYDQAYWDDQYKPEGRNQYLERTRYASDQSQAESGRDSLRGRGGRADARSRIEAIAAETDQRVRELIERQADAGAAAGAQQGAADRRQEDRGGADAGQPVRSPGSSTGGVSGVDAAAGLPRYGKPISGAVSAIGYHFSKHQRSSLNSSYYGTGLRGAESDRLSGPQNSDIRPRVFFYVDKGNGVRPEAGVGNVAHGVRLDNLYDIMGDPLGIIRAVRGMPGDASNNQERAVLQAGFDGYIKRDPVMPQDFIVLLGKQHGDVPVAPANPRRADGKTNSRQEPARTQERTRQEGDELVRRPQGMELNQIVKVRDEIKFAAPSFRLQYGEARVLASEAAMADQILADAGSTFQFGGPQFSMSDDFDERGAFNLDVNDEQLEWSPDFADGIEVAEKKDIDFDALQAELDQEFGRFKQRPARQSIDEPTDQQIKDAGLHAEDAIAFGPHKTTTSNIMLDAPKFLGVEAYVNYEIRRFDDRFAPTTDLDDISTFISGGKHLTEKAAVQFTQNQLAAEYLHKRGFDLADTYRKGTVLKIAEGWKALAKKAGAFKYPGSNIKSTSFKEIAAAMGLFKEYRVDVEYDEEVIFTDRKSGKAFHATIMERADEIGCCTLGLAGSQLGVPFYTVAGKMAENIGKKFVADTSLSAINAYRRTEQALSYALKSGDTGVMLPGPQNRVYGYNEKPKTQQDHDWNIARLALANLRNVEELIPDVRRWSYDPATGQFVDSKGASAEEAVNAALADPDVRALGIGRTTIARAVLTSQIIKGDFKAGNVEAFESPVLYSRTMVEEDPQPLSETWGQLNADGTYELAPKFAKWFGDSKVVDAEGKPLVVYHGTNADFDVFEKPSLNTMADRASVGFWFTSAKQDAVKYGGSVKEVYLSIKKPRRITRRKLDEMAVSYPLPELMKRLKAGGSDGLIIESIKPDPALEEKGMPEQYVAFRPEQIKSAIGNNGNFDAGNPDIRYSRKDVESYMAQRNRGMRQVSSGSEQANDISMALAAMKELSAQMKPVHEKLSKQMSGEALQKAVMSQFRDFVLPVGRTPHVLTMLGAPNSMMKIDPSIVYKVFVDKHANDLEGAKAEDIIKAIYQPAMVLRGGKNEMELVLPIVTSTGPLIVPVLSDSVMPTNNGRVSAIMSIYPRKVSLGGNSVLQRIKDGKLAYADAALAQVALTGNVSPQAGITAREVSLSSGTPPARTSQANVADAASLVKPANPYYVGWDKARDDIIGGIASKKVKSDVDLVRWIGNNFRGSWDDAPAFSHNPLSPNFKLDPENRWLKVQRVMQDYFNRVDQVQRMVADQGGVLREENDTYRAEERSYGRIHEEIKDFADKWVRPMVEKAAKANVTMDELSLYAYAMHAKERNARIAKINPQMPDGGSGMTDAEADAILAKFKADPRAAAVRDLHADLMAITATTRRVLLEEGLITDEQFNQLDGMYQNYVPLRGFENESDPRIQQLLEERGARMGTGQGYSIKGNETMRALGRRTKAGDIIENIVNDYQRAVVRGEKNAVARTFYQFVLDNPSPNLWEIDAEKTKRSLGLDGKVKERVVLDKDDNTTVAVKLNGEEVFIKVKDPLLARAIKKMHSNDMGEQLRTLTRGLSAYSALLRNTLTRFNPEFAIVNLVRDAGFGTFAVLDELGERGVAKFWKHYAASNASAHRYEMGKLDPVNSVSDRYFTEYRMAGGTTGGFYMKDADQVRSDIRDMMLAAGATPNGLSEKVRASMAYQWARKAGAVLEHVGAVSENAARVAAFRAAREMGNTPAEAAKIAKNLTTNFNRKGEYGQILNTLFLFYNASVQGSQRTIKMLSNPKVQGYMAGVVASTMAIALANAWGAGDDEDDGQAYWDKIPDHVKERNLIIMLPPGYDVDGAETVGSKGRYLAIPVQYGLNVFTTLGYSLADMARHYGQDKTRGHGALKAATNLASVTFGSYNPFGGSVDNAHAAAMIFLPTAADTVYQLANGVNSFGTPVSPFKSELDSKPDSENVNARQAGGPAHSLARWVNNITGGDDTVSGMVDISPGSIENVWGNITGGTGRFINDVLTLTFNGLEYAAGGDPDIYINKVPVFRKVYGEVDGGVDQGLFYDRRRMIQDARQEVKAKEESGREVRDTEVLALESMSSEANKFTREIAKLRREMIDIGKDPEMSATEKRTLIRELKAQRDSITREFNRMFIETMKAEASGDFAVE